MSRFNQKARQQARTDSRRFAKGTVCRILHGQGKTGDLIIDILYRYQLAPSFMLFANRKDGNGLRVAADPQSNRLLVIPVTEYRDLENLLNDLGQSIDIGIKVPESKPATGPNEYKNTNDAEKSNLIENKYYKIVDFLRQNLIMVRVPISRVPNGSLIDPAIYDVLIETIDVSQTIDGLLVDRTNYDVDSVTPTIFDTNEL